MVIQELLGRPGLREIRVLAGPGVTGRPVKAVAVCEREAGVEFLGGGELVCLELHALTHNAADLLRRLAAREIAAVAVRLPAGEDLPPPTAAAAAAAGLPVLLVPDEWSWDRFSQVVYHEIYIVAVSRDLLEEFITLVLGGGDVGQIVERLYALLGCPVALFGTGLQLVSAGGEAPAARTVADLGRKLLRLPSGGPSFGRHQIRLDDEATCTVKLVSFRGEIYGYLVVFADAATLQPQDLLALHHGSTAIALHLLQLEADLQAQHQQLHRFTVDLIMGRHSSLDAIRARGRALGFDPAGRFYVALCKVGHEDEATHTTRMGRLRRPVRELLTRGLTRAMAVRSLPGLATEFGDKVLVLCGEPASERRGQRLKLMLDEAIRELQPLLTPATVNVGISAAAETALQLPEAYEQSIEALNIGERIWGPGHIAAYDELGSYRVLARSSSPALLEFTARLLKPVLDYDHLHGNDLLGTLRTLLDCNLQTEACARALHMHPNTVRYRQRRLESLTGVHLGDPKERFDLLLALRVLDLTGADQLTSASVEARPARL